MTHIVQIASNLGKHITRKCESIALLFRNTHVKESRKKVGNILFQTSNISSYHRKTEQIFFNLNKNKATAQLEIWKKMSCVSTYFLSKGRQFVTKYFIGFLRSFLYRKKSEGLKFPQDFQFTLVHD